MKRIHFFVSGSVQGVCYRHYAAKKACELGIKGFVRNLTDGRVEVFAEGKDGNIDEFLKCCRACPGYSRVDSIDMIKEEGIERFSFNDFKII